MIRGWLDGLLWRCRWYRRRVMRRSGVWTALMQEHPEVARFEFRISDKERVMLGDAAKTETKLLALQLHRRGMLSDDAMYAALDLDTPAILARGPKSFLEPRTENLSRRAGSWPILSECVACRNGDHGLPVYPQGSCGCPCHGGTRGAA